MLTKTSNSLGLQNTTEPLVLVLLSFTWDNPIDDESITALGKELDSWILEKAKEEGVWNEWVYLNYAASWQDVIKGYGEENGEMLRRISRKFDGEGVFQRQVGGGLSCLFEWGMEGEWDIKRHFSSRDRL